MRDLDRFKLIDKPGGLIAIVGMVIANIRDAPYPTCQEFGMFFYGLIVNADLSYAQVGETGFIAILFFIKTGLHLVDELVFAFFPNPQFDQLCLIPMHIMPAEDLPYRFQATFNRLFIIRGTVLSQQVFQHIRGHDSIAFEQHRQVLADDLSGKMLIYFFVQTHSFFDQKSRSISV